MMAILMPPPIRKEGTEPPVVFDEVRARPVSVWGWLDDRLGLSALRYLVPLHANSLWYTLGGITFVGILVLVITGVWLGQFYDPEPTGARESVLYIQNVVPLGDVIRGIHVWTAYLVVLTAAVHLIRIFVTASYKIPREVNWLIGLTLLGLLLFGAVFTGTMLRWDQESYEAMAHQMELAALLGALGGFFSHAFTTSVSMLARIYVAHVSIIPLLLALLLVAHFFLVKHHGISPTPAQADAGEAPGGRLPLEKQTGHYPTHLRLMASYGLALVALAGMLGVVFPQSVGPAPDPTMEVTKPAFLYYWMYAFEDWFGLQGILFAGIGLFGLLALLPFVDRVPWRSPRRRWLLTVFGMAALAAILVLSMITALRPVVQHLS